MKNTILNTVNDSARPGSPLLRGLLSAGLLLGGAITARAQTSYYWVGGSNGSWSVAANWNTSPAGSGSARSTAAATDVLIFDGGTPVVTLDAGATGTIGRLRLVNNAAATFTIGTTNNVSTVRNLTIGTNLLVESGSALQVVGTGEAGSFSAANLNLILAPGATASIAGAVTFSGVGGNSNASVTHQFQGATAGSVQFTNGGSLTTTGPTLQGSPFQATPGLAVFGAGSTFQQEAAADPYGPATFVAGSTFRFVGGALSPVSAPRTYGNLEFRNSSAQTLSGTAALTVLNQLSATGSAAATIATSGTTSIGGDVVANAPLSFAPTATSTLVFNGSAGQTVRGTVAPTFGPNALLELNNSGAGLTLNQPITVQRGLRLTRGLLNTSASAGLLTMPVSATVAGGSDAAYVNGPIARAVPAGSSFDVQFPVGKNGHFRPMRLNISTQTNAVTYTAEQVETAPAQQFAAGSGLTRVSYKRYFQLSPSVPPTGFSGQVTLYFDADDAVNFAAHTSFVMAKNDAANSAWSNVGRAANTGNSSAGDFISGTLTSQIFSALAMGASFSLGSTTSDLAMNPLPVSLTSFGAVARPAGVHLTWATASEQNSRHFEVQRSADGERFRTLGEVAAAGRSATPRRYAFADAQPLPGVAYYRLRQVDHDGQSAFSPVVAVPAYASIDLAAYPTRTRTTVTLPAASAGLHYRVRNALGQELLSGAASGGQVLNVADLPQGIYFLELSGAGSRHTQRLVRE